MSLNQTAFVANAQQHGLRSHSPAGRSEFPSQSLSGANQPDQENRLSWLDLNTRPAAVRQALIALLNEAMKDTRDAKRAGHFLLALWSPSQYHQDLNDLGFLERELNFAVRHLLNFIIAGQASLRQLLTHSEMEPVISAWGGAQHD